MADTSAANSQMLWMAKRVSVTVRATDASATPTNHPKRYGWLLTATHLFYSLHQSFEHRMKVAGIDEELRRIPMRHPTGRLNRVKGGTLA